MDLQANKAGTYLIYQKPAHAIGLSAPPIGCVLDLVGLPGGGNKIYDRSPYGNHGLITGAVWKRLPSGLWYLEFDGSDDRVSGSLSITGTQMAISIWLNLTELAGTRRMIYLGACEVGFSVNDRLFVHTTTSSGTDSNTPHFYLGLTAGTFSLLTVTWDTLLSSNNVKVYLNDVLKSTTTLANAKGGNFNISSWRLGNVTSSFYGGLVLYKVCNRALSALEIQNSFKQEKHLLGVG